MLTAFLQDKVLRAEIQWFSLRQHSTLQFESSVSFNLHDAVWSSLGRPEPSGSMGLDFIVVDIY